MDFKQKLYLQKENGQAFTILLVMTLIFVAVSLYAPVQLLIQGVSGYYLTFIYVLLSTLAFAALPLILEKKRASFSAHLLFLTIFLKDYLKGIFSNQSYTPLSFIILIVGLIATFYVVVKLFTHFDELNKYIRRIDRMILILMVLALFRIYFDSSFESMMTYLLILISISLSTDTKEVLPFVTVVYFNATLMYLVRLFSYTSAPIDQYLIIFLNIAISIFIIYKSVTLYLDKSRNDINFVS